MNQQLPAPATAPTLEPAPVATPLWQMLGMHRFSGLYLAAVLLIVFALTIPNLFFTSQNFRAVSTGEAITVVAAFAIMIPLAAGMFDLSVAASLGFCSVVSTSLQSNGHGLFVAILVPVLVGALVGVVNAILIVRFDIDSFIATLGMSSVIAAAALLVTDGKQVVQGISPEFTQIATGSWLGIPRPLYYIAVTGAVLWFVFELRPEGRYLYAIGENIAAARLAGVRVNRLRAGALIAGGTFAGLGGVLLGATLGIGDPFAGPAYLLPAFTAALLGATQIHPGRTNVLGALIAVYLLAVGIKGLQLSGADTFVNPLFNGLALIVAVGLAARARTSS